MLKILFIYTKFKYKLLVARLPLFIFDIFCKESYGMKFGGTEDSGDYFTDVGTVGKGDAFT